MPEERISRLRVPEEQTLPEDIQELYAKNREKPGFVPNVFQAYSLRPAQLRGFIALYDSIMEADSGLTKAEREMIAVAVSAENHCFYCLVSHGAILRKPRDDGRRSGPDRPEGKTGCCDAGAECGEHERARAHQKAWPMLA